jgi:hypothetical protein
VHAAKVFDIRTTAPIEIKNDTIEYRLFYQAVQYIREDPAPHPYDEYFIDSIEFQGGATAVATIFEKDSSHLYSYTRDDCGIDLFSPFGDRHVELTHGGDEATEKRYALFDHRKKGFYHDSVYHKIDTFSFIEFRLGAFTTYEDIIRQFALDHPGEYDTVGIELIENRTRE